MIKRNFKALQRWKSPSFAQCILWKNQNFRIFFFWRTLYKSWNSSSVTKKKKKKKQCISSFHYIKLHENSFFWEFDRASRDRFQNTKKAHFSSTIHDKSTSRTKFQSQFTVICNWTLPKCHDSVSFEISSITYDSENNPGVHAFQSTKKTHTGKLSVPRSNEPIFLKI